MPTQNGTVRDGADTINVHVNSDGGVDAVRIERQPTATLDPMNAGAAGYQESSSVQVIENTINVEHYTDFVGADSALSGSEHREAESPVVAEGLKAAYDRMTTHQLSDTEVKQLKGLQDAVIAGVKDGFAHGTDEIVNLAQAVGTPTVTVRGK